MKKIKNNLRLFIQLAFTALTNGYVKGFTHGKIYQGKLKMICVPGLNCYSCPGALGACPLGSLQSSLSSRDMKLAFYVLGLLMLFGTVFGRFICGFLCPFGLVQDLLYKIPFVKKLKNMPGHKALTKLKYVFLIVFVVLLPSCIRDITNQGTPWFCKYICPSGTLLAGIPLTITNEQLRAATGILFAIKVSILIIIVLLSIVFYRPFCKYICPLGAFYGLFNKVSLIRYNINKEKCTSCNKCTKVCKMGIDVKSIPNSAECIRCNECIKACPEEAIRITSFRK